MAEALAVVGVVSSIVELVEFANKCVTHLEEIRKSVTGVPELLSDVALQLPLLIQSLRRTQLHIDRGHYDPQDSDALQLIIQGCQAQIALLEDILAKATPKQYDSKVTRSRKAFYSLRHEQALLKINSKISGYIEKLVLFQSAQASDFIIRSVLETLRPTKRALTDREYESDATTTEPAGESCDVSSDMAKATGNRNRKASIAIYNRGRRRFSTFISFTRLNALWAIQASLDVAWGSGSYSIVPTLQLQRLVRYTSPGFRVLWKCENELMDWSVAYKELGILFQTGQASPFDINSRGETFIDRMLLNSRGYRTDQQLSLIKMLSEYGARMTHRGSFYFLFSSALHYGKHGLRTSSSLGGNLIEDAWNCYSSYILPIFLSLSLPQRSTDPFLLYFLSDCSKHVFGAWGQTPLMDIIPTGSADEIIKYLQDNRVLHGKNIFGQSAIHLSIARPTILSLLLDAGADADARDKRERSLLEYAAAYGFTESAVLLLEAGAHPVSYDRSGQRHLTFLDLAREYEHWDLITRAFSFLGASPYYSDEFLKDELNYISIGHWKSPERLKAKGFECLFKLGVDPNLIIDWKPRQHSAYDRTLLHRDLDYETVKVLFESGFNRINHADTSGMSPLMVALMTVNDSKIYKAILKRGGNVNHQNARGHSVLHILAVRMGYTHLWNDFMNSETISEKVVKIATLLSNGTDQLTRDNCRCPCSRNGCSASTMLQRYNCGPKNYFWLLEWLLVTRECGDADTVKEVFLDLIRVLKFEALEMTHVCCRKSNSAYIFYSGFHTDEEGAYEEEVAKDEEEVDELLDEQKHLIRELDDFVTKISSSFADTPEDGLLHVLPHVLSHMPIKERNFDNYWHWREWKDGRLCSHYDKSFPPNRENFRLEELQNLGVSTASSAVGPRFYFHEPTDRYFEDRGQLQQHIPPPVEKLYMDWVDHFYENRDAYDYPRPITEEWYTTRKYWAGRLAEVLKAARARGPVEEIPDEPLKFSAFY